MYKGKDLLLSPDTFNDPIFSTHLRCFRWYGYVSSRNQRNPWLHLLRCTIFTASIWLSCVLLLARVVRGYDNLNDGATTCATAVQYFAVSIATLNAYVQRERVISLLRIAHDDLQRFLVEADEQELTMLHSTQSYISTITLMLLVPSVAAGLLAWLDCIFRTIFYPESVFNVPAVVRGEAKPILLFQLYPFGEVIDNFLVGYLGPWGALFLGVSTIPLWHTFVTALMKYITLRLEILNRRVQRMDISRISRSKSHTELTSDEVNRLRLQLCTSFIKEELKILQFVRELEILICVPVMADFIIFSVLICFLFCALTLGSPSKIDCFFIFLYIFVMASILWVYHWHATLIVEWHSALGFGYYASNWYDFSLSVQRMLLLIITHAQRPLQMRALLVELNLRTFIDIVRGAYSYFNILRSSR
ncbi:odorant receptor 56a [Scaptodrosophila lebanonensis]|uniref:Odorant receptor n=1 Tax=Drosophila lebanonensis TaxID=7225 RepID=A0A6J2UJY2_DROLE|nr:odorant receptor 56a [Scaptodrosophila lebanonensis]